MPAFDVVATHAEFPALPGEQDGDLCARRLVARLRPLERGGVLRPGLVHPSTAAKVDRTVEALAHLAAGTSLGSRPFAR
jgi:hypothetical protein